MKMKMNNHFNTIKAKKDIILFAASVILLFFSFSYNIFNIGYPELGGIPSQFESFQSESEALVLGKVDKFVMDGRTNLGGFLYIDERLPAYAPGPYFSQVGLQGMIVGTFAPNNKGDLLQYYHIARLFFAFLTALTLSFFVLAVNKEFGLITAIFLMFSISYSPWIVFFAKNLYWATPLLFLPFILSWTTYSYFNKKEKLVYFFVLISLAVFLKALSGYEYITNVAMAALVPVFYFQIKEGNNLWQTCKNIVLVGLSGIVGFFLAIAVHVIQLSFNSHSIYNSIMLIFSNAKLRTYDQSGAGGVYALVEKTSLISILKGYLLRPIVGDSKFLYPEYLDSLNIKLPNLSFANSGYLIFSLGGVILLVIIFSFVVFCWWKFTKKYNIKINILLFAVFASLLVSFSWATLAKGHMIFHNHFNEIIFCIPFILLCYLLFGYMLQLIISNIIARYATFKKKKRII